MGHCDRQNAVQGPERWSDIAESRSGREKIVYGTVAAARVYLGSGPRHACRPPSRTEWRPSEPTALNYFFLAAVVLFAALVAFFAGVALAVVALAAAGLRAVVALAVVAFLAVVALAGALAAAVLVAAARVVAGLAAVARVRVVVAAARVDGRAAAVRVVAAVLRAVDAVAVLRGAATFGSFFAPLTTSLKVVPARKAGTLVFLTFTVSPVRGLRAVRAARARFSNTPKPVMFTFSPLLTVRTITSTRPSTAAPAAFLSPSLSESASMSWALFTLQSSVDHTSFSAKPADFLATVCLTRHFFHATRPNSPRRVSDFVAWTPYSRSLRSERGTQPTASGSECSSSRLPVFP